ncbi:hypothetical protein LV89_01276 [Arcicella aurantiaca]|uniref:Uncharacterized protein n=1 Tax=Arcicella aurantiaca TaxID=591202 RepID=A0A316ECZ0_9BACT|nr:hypothetical protein [Arcicella aurantiaca]PWK27869.1 hypothetical protein LV89_01276 [Arcicella aurantiaca]
MNNNQTYYDRKGILLTLSSESIDLIKDATNDYLLYLTIDWFLEKNNLSLSSSMGAEGEYLVPKFNPIGILFYPLYFSTANGHSKNLFKTLSPIKEFPFGLYSENIMLRVFHSAVRDNIRDNISKYFIARDGQFYVKSSSIANIESLIESEPIDLKTDLKFEDVYIEKDDTTSDNKYSSLIDALKSARKSLDIADGRRFFNYGLNDFKKKYNEHKNKISNKELTSL